MTLAEALVGKNIPQDIRETQVLLDLPHLSFGRVVRTGQLVVHRDLADETRAIFEKLLRHGFPIQQMVPVSAFGWSDDASMAANNTSGFNYRTIFGTTRFSKHATGRAIDVNPALNPYVLGDYVAPVGATYDPLIPGTVTQDVAEIFKQRGWEWGGDWTTRKDWQHFEKP